MHECVCVCVFAGGIVSGDELMAVNGKILIDATLDEGQNSLARAWSSGGVGLRSALRIFIIYPGGFIDPD